MDSKTNNTHTYDWLAVILKINYNITIYSESIKQIHPNFHDSGILIRVESLKLLSPSLN